jgi:hypothetical protein
MGMEQQAVAAEGHDDVAVVGSDQLVGTSVSAVRT